MYVYSMYNYNLLYDRLYITIIYTGEQTNVHISRESNASYQCHIFNVTYL